MEKSHVGMGHHVCPVCGIKHDEVVLLDRRLRNTLTPHEFVGFKMCPQHQALFDDGYIALIEVNSKPKDFQTADRTGALAHVRAEAFTKLFHLPVPEQGTAFVEVGTIKKLEELVATIPKNPT